ncbi:MAG: hypothetical protein D8M59_07490 [Planctomycetes bacterium]|nr:hypothetical protein [Planctomycetota bacterium]
MLGTWSLQVYEEEACPLQSGSRCRVGMFNSRLHCTQAVFVLAWTWWDTHRSSLYPNVQSVRRYLF